MREILTALVAALALGVTAQTQQPKTIRTGITIVPIDVRVVDRHGKAVTDLKQEDFTILEDGIPQIIRHFSTQAFTADPSAILPQPEFRRAETGAVAPRNRRVFLVMLGRGRHGDVSGYVDALARFLGERVLPQDQVALIAWNRATDFTTDRQLIRRTVERYRDRHHQIETDLKEWFSGLRAIYGSKEIPKHIQQQIDAVFEGAVALRPRQLTPGQITAVEQIDNANTRAAGDLLRDQLVKLPDDGSGPAGLTAPIANRMIDTPIHELIERSAQLRHDLGNVYTGIDYLRYLEGEKHLVVLTEHGMSIPHLDMNTRLARVASDARVAVDIIQTGGTAGPAPPRINTVTGGIIREKAATTRAVFDQGFGIQDLRQIAEVTGGQLHAFTRAEQAFVKLEEGMRFQYLLGYAPANPRLDSRFRQIAIKVNRPGLQVMHRQGYFATEQFVPLDRRQFITVSRIHAAGQYGGTVDHIKVQLGSPRVDGSASAREISVDVTVDISRLKFAPAEGRHVAALDVALFCGDGRRHVVGETWSRVDLKLTDAMRDQMLKTGTTFRLTARLRGDAHVLKVVVYDFAADLAGTAVTNVR